MCILLQSGIGKIIDKVTRMLKVSKSTRRLQSCVSSLFEKNIIKSVAFGFPSSPGQKHLFQDFAILPPLLAKTLFWSRIDCSGTLNGGFMLTQYSQRRTQVDWFDRVFDPHPLYRTRQERLLKDLAYKTLWLHKDYDDRVLLAMECIQITPTEKKYKEHLLLYIGDRMNALEELFQLLDEFVEYDIPLVF